MKFSCPQCGQHITCDELWAGHEIQCPGCQATLQLPAAQPAPQPAGRALVPPPPAKPGKLSLNQQQAAATAQAQAGGRNIPIRNLTAPPPKKKNIFFTLAKITAIIAALGIGGYYGFTYIKGMQDKVRQKSLSGESDGGEVGHIQELNNVLDATEPGKIGQMGAGSRRARSGAEGASAAAPDAAAGATAAADTNAPVIPAVYTLEIATAKIPEGRVNGKISGTNFVAETCRLDPTGGSLALRFLQGQLVSPDQEVLIYLRLKTGEKLGGQTLTIPQDMRGTGVPQVTKRWKTNPRYAPQMKSYITGYAMKLELGQPAEGMLPGKIYLALPDTEQTVVAGVFKATLPVIDPNAAVQTMPAATPVAPSTPDANFQKRYGIRR